MNMRFLPDDIPVPDDLTPEAITALANVLRGRAKPAASRGEVLARIAPLARAAALWLDESSGLRARALDELPAASPFPRAMWADAIEMMFAPITPDALARFVEAELEGLDSPAFPPLAGHVLAGNVPAPAVQSIFCSLLAGAGTLVKTAVEDRLFPVLLAESMKQAAPELADALAVVHWPGQSAEHNRALADSADAVVAFGRGMTIAAWRELAGGKLIAHGPRTSLEVIELGNDAPALAAAVARDVAMYDQQGCLSPQQVYLLGSSEQCVDFAVDLSAALTERAATWPIAGRDMGQKLAIRRLRETQRIRKLSADDGARPWLLAGGPNRFDWTLVGTAGDTPQIGPGGRTVFLTRTPSAESAADAIAPIAPMIQGIATNLPDAARAPLPPVPCTCAPGQLQRPPFGWRNDGVAPLGCLNVGS